MECHPGPGAARASGEAIPKLGGFQWEDFFIQAANLPMGFYYQPQLVSRISEPSTVRGWFRICVLIFNPTNGDMILNFVLKSIDMLLKKSCTSWDIQCAVNSATN